jgi:homoserine O-succinyltransferase
MPIYLDRDSFSTSAAKRVDIGLVNNMPDRALKATERQFTSLLASAADGVEVHLTLFALPDVPRTETGRRHISSFYSPIENLWDRRLDGLIVTGTEPRASSLTGEPYWAGLARLIEWAEENTHSTVWSCLAAHAAVLHTDGIRRRRLPEKRFGVFECARVSDHHLTSGLPARLTMPHSRWNDLAENELAASGYSVLTRSEDAGVDMFVKQRQCLHVFFQGHPEYKADTLLLEYNRDVGRYLNHESDTYPPLPCGYFDRDTADALTSLRERALGERRDPAPDFEVAQAGRNLTNRWRSSATHVYGNWLKYLFARKQSDGRKDFGRERDPLPTGRLAAGD